MGKIGDLANVPGSRNILPTWKSETIDRAAGIDNLTTAADLVHDNLVSQIETVRGGVGILEYVQPAKIATAFPYNTRTHKLRQFYRIGK